VAGAPNVDSATGPNTTNTSPAPAAGFRSGARRAGAPVNSRGPALKDARA